MLYPTYSETQKLKKMGDHLSHYKKWSIYKLIKILKHSIEPINTEFNINYSNINNIMLEFESGKIRKTQN